MLASLSRYRAVRLVTALLAGCLLATSAMPALAMPIPAMPIPAMPILAMPVPVSGGSGLILDAGNSRTVNLVGPGQSVHWPIGLTTHVTRLDSLALSVRAVGPLVQMQSAVGAPSLVTIGLASCSSPWIAATCPQHQQSLLGDIPLTALDGTLVRLTDPKVLLAQGVYILVSLTLSDSAAETVQGQTVQVIVTASATGVLDSSPPRHHPGVLARHSGALATTGQQIVGYAVLGLLAVVCGIGLAGFARRRRVGGADG